MKVGVRMGRVAEEAALPQDPLRKMTGATGRNFRPDPGSHPYTI